MEYDKMVKARENALRTSECPPDLHPASKFTCHGDRISGMIE